jgi:hypothetical protein
MWLTMTIRDERVNALFTEQVQGIARVISTMADL